MNNRNRSRARVLWWRTGQASGFKALHAGWHHPTLHPWLWTHGGRLTAACFVTSRYCQLPALTRMPSLPRPGAGLSSLPAGLDRSPRVLGGALLLGFFMSWAEQAGDTASDKRPAWLGAALGLAEQLLQVRSSGASASSCLELRVNTTHIGG